MVAAVRLRSAPLAGASLFVVLSLALGRASSAAWDPIPLEAWQEPARPDSGGADAIILFERTECRQKESEFEMDYFARSRVFTAEGRAVGDLEIRYIKKSWKLTNLRARSVHPNGTSVELDPATVVTTTAWKYRDYEVLKASVAVPGVEPGCIVEWAYTLSGPRGYWTGWRFQFSNDFYTCSSTNVWKVPRDIWQGVRPAVRYGNIFAHRVEEVYVPSREQPTSVSFTARCLGGTRDELFSPPAVDAAPRVDVFCQRFGAEPTTHWSEWKHLFDEYQTELGKTPGGLDKLVAGFREGAADDLGALRVAFHWVQSTISCRDELEWARRPDAERIEKSYRYADTLKELLERHEASALEINALMVAIARKLRFTASVGMVGDREFERFDTRVMGFPPENFITVVRTADDVLYLQPNSRFAIFGSLPWNLRGGECLLSGETTDLFCRVSADAGEPARSDWTLTLDLSPSGELAGRIAARLAGEEGTDWRRALWEDDPAHWQGYVEERLAQEDGPKATVQPVALGPPGDTLFVFEATARWPSVATADAERIEVPFERLVPWRTRARFLLERRSRPVLLRYTRDETIRLQLKLPPGMTVEQLPPPAEFSNELGSWAERWSLSGGVVKVERHVEIGHAEIPLKGYSLVREFFDSLEREDQTVLLVVKEK
jgi:hypothetical protein